MENQSVDYIVKLAFERKEDLQLLKTSAEAILAFIKANKKRNFCFSHSFHVI